MQQPSAWMLRRAIYSIRRGGIIAYPTEAVYGLGCDPLNGPAIGRLLRLKGRPADKGLILIAASFRQLRPYIRLLDEQLMQPILASWPGPNSWLLPAADALPDWLSGGRSSLAVRVTAHPLAAALCRAWGGPLVSTSANPSGRLPARTPLHVRSSFLHGGIDLILHGTTGGTLDRPTCIRDGLTGETLRH